MAQELLLALLTVPSVAWLFLRVAIIVIRHRRPLQFHFKQALRDKSKTRRNSISFAIHVLIGLAVLAAAPYLAYACLPPPENGGKSDSMLGSSLHNSLLVVSAGAMAVTYLSVLWLIPHPDHYQSYGCDSERELTRAISMLLVSALQFVAMALVPLGLLVPFLRVPFTVIAVGFYLWTCVVCAAELKGVAWEKKICGDLGLRWLIGDVGPKQKSKLTQAFLGSEPVVLQAQWMTCLVLGLIGAVQCMFMLRSWILQPSPPVPHRQDEFYVVMVLYQDAVMGAGFFTLTQLTLELNAAEPSAQWLKTVYICELCLTQVVPIGLMALGPPWTGADSFLEFCAQWMLWGR